MRMILANGTSEKRPGILAPETNWTNGRQRQAIYEPSLSVISQVPSARRQAVPCAFWVSPSMTTLVVNFRQGCSAVSYVSVGVTR